LTDGGERTCIPRWIAGRAKAAGARHNDRHAALVLEWAVLHRAELKRDWELARDGRSPETIAPLD